MQQPNRQPNNTSLGAEDFAGWPGTVGIERLERAIDYVRNHVSPIATHPNSGDPALDHDIFMTANSMTSPHLGSQLDLSVLDNSSSVEWLFDLVSILRSLETEHHFACAFLTVEENDALPPDEAEVAIRHVFTMAKAPDWMGLCVSLPHIKGLHVHAVQSSIDPEAPCAMIAVPTILMEDDIEPSPPTPEGGMASLESITRWHGAQTFHWSTATDATAP